MILEEAYKFHKSSKESAGCAKPQYSLRKTSGLGTPFCVKSKTIIQIMNFFTKFMVISRKPLNFGKLQILGENCILGEKSCPEPLIFHKEY